MFRPPGHGYVQRMSDEMTNVEEPEWPTHCKDCGTELQPEVIDLVHGEGDQELTTVVAHDVCPNPDCSKSGNAVAPMTEGESERWLNRPGAEGGANGGA